MAKLVHGVGINDADYRVTIRQELSKVGGKRKQKLIWICPYYRKWSNMLERCYSKIRHNIEPSYIGCVVCEDWKYFSNFKKWVDSQPNTDWQNCELDKDLLSPENKIYSPDTCVFTSRKINQFLVYKKRNNGVMLLGVSPKDGRFQAHCSDTIMGRPVYLGTYDTEIEAHLAWRAKKHEVACRLAELETDPRVQEALRNRYK